MSRTSTEELLRLAPADRPAALLLRHAERKRYRAPPGGVEPVPDGEPVTEQGRRLARAMGQQLALRLGQVRASPIVRCMNTAEELAAGAGRAAESAVPDSMLGTGVHIADRAAFAPHYKRLGFGQFVRYILSGEGSFAGALPPAQAAVRLVRHMFQAAPDAGINVFVTHDIFMLSTLIHLLQRPDMAQMEPEFLEGIVFVPERSGIRVIYRDIARQVEMDWQH